MMWPNFQINTLNPLEVPLLNTIVLLRRGFTVTLAHHFILENNISQTSLYLILTVSLGFYFTFLQYREYKETTFSISDSIYGSIFFIGTGFHGFHVIVGSLFLLTVLSRIANITYSKDRHLGFELAAWY